MDGVFLYLILLTVIVGVGQMQESTYEKTYLETDLNTGECRDIAVKSRVSLPSSTKSQVSESLPVIGAVTTSLQGISSVQGFPGQSTFPQKSTSGVGNSQQVPASRYTPPGTGYSGLRGQPVSGTGFPPDDVRKLSSERTDPPSGAYSVASSRPSFQQTASKPGTDAGNWADRRLGPEAVKTEADYQHGQVISSGRDHVEGVQYSRGRQLAANAPSVSMQVSCEFVVKS